MGFLQVTMSFTGVASGNLLSIVADSFPLDKRFFTTAPRALLASCTPGASTTTTQGCESSGPLMRTFLTKGQKGALDKSAARSCSKRSRFEDLCCFATRLAELLSSESAACFDGQGLTDHPECKKAS